MCVCECSAVLGEPELGLPGILHLSLWKKPPAFCGLESLHYNQNRSRNCHCGMSGCLNPVVELKESAAVFLKRDLVAVSSMGSGCFVWPGCFLVLTLGGGRKPGSNLAPLTFPSQPATAFCSIKKLLGCWNPAFFSLSLHQSKAGSVQGHC